MGKRGGSVSGLSRYKTASSNVSVAETHRAVSGITSGYAWAHIQQSSLVLGTNRDKKPEILPGRREVINALYATPRKQ